MVRLAGARYLSFTIFCYNCSEAYKISSQQTLSFHLLSVKQESKQQCQTPPEKRPNEKWVSRWKRRPPRVPPSPHPISTVESKAWRISFLAPHEKNKEIPERRRKRPKPLYKCFSFDDVWMERNQKRKLEKETQPEKGIQLQHLAEDQFKVRNRAPSSSFSGTVFLSAPDASFYCQHNPVLVLYLVPVPSAFTWFW